MDVQTHIATSLEALLASQGQHEGKRCNVANTTDVRHNDFMA